MEQGQAKSLSSWPLDQERFAQALLDSSQEIAIFALDLDFNYMIFNERHRQIMAHIWGVEIRKGINLLSLITHEPDRLRAEEYLTQAACGYAFQVIEQYGDEQLNRRWYENAYAPIRDTDGTILGVSVYVSDVTQQKLYEDRLNYLATMDEMTGIPNRRYFCQRLTDALYTSRHSLALALIDIDHFKAINDQYGHEAGDRALIHIARILTDGVRREDFVGRLGGEEFGIFFQGVHACQAHAVVQRIGEQLRQAPFYYAGNTLRLTLSAGVVAHPPHCSESPDLDYLLRQADRAMYHAKAGGRDRVYLALESHTNRVPARPSGAPTAAGFALRRMPRHSG